MTHCFYLCCFVLLCVASLSNVAQWTICAAWTICAGWTVTKGVFLCGHLAECSNGHAAGKSRPVRRGCLLFCARLCSTEAGHELCSTVVTPRLHQPWQLADLVERARCDRALKQNQATDRVPLLPDVPASAFPRSCRGTGCAALCVGDTGCTALQIGVGCHL